MSGTAAEAARAADAVEAVVARSLAPSPEFLDRLRAVREELVATTERVARESGSRMRRCLVAGSAARGGFLTDRVDVDFFLLFPPELSRADLEREGLELARRVLPRHEIRYAEHPYLRGAFAGFQVDVVPGYEVPDGAHPISAVDRTPFHQAYLLTRETPALLEQVRLTKQFLRALGVYGSEARTGGFSGYLVELLVVRYGRFRALLEEARDWRPPVRLVVHGGPLPRVPEEVALILDDPVDPARNVSSALTLANLATFVLAARGYLDRPSEAWFEVPARARVDRAEGVRRAGERGTHVAVLGLPRPSLVDDVLYPQLRKAERGVREAIDRLGFQGIGTGAGADADGLVVAVEVAHGELPNVRVRDGPPVGLDRVNSFLGKWSVAGTSVLQGPYVRSDGTLAVETARTERRLEPLLLAELPNLSLGQDLRGLVGSASCRPLAEARDGPALHDALRELFDKRVPGAPA
jgi:tRNA nucleotidyltransferase (CCA-adding enzyme)